MIAAWGILLGALALAGLAAWAVIWSRRDVWWRHFAVPALVISMAALGVSLAQVLGHHRPVWLATDLGTEYRVIASKLEEGVAIWLYLDQRGEPLPLMLPWSEGAAQRLQDAERESKRRGREGAILQFDPSLDDNEPQFHPLPQQATRLPKGKPPPALRYNRTHF